MDRTLDIQARRMLEAKKNTRRIMANILMALTGRIVEIETTDKLTDPRIVAKVKEHFGIDRSLHQAQHAS